MKSFSQLVEEMKGTYVGVRFSEKSLKTIKSLQKMYKIPDPTPADDIHATICYSRTPVDFIPKTNLSEKIDREVCFHVFNTGDGKRALVLKIKSDYLKKRHNDANELGASYDYPDYIPHITLSYDIGEKMFPTKKFKLESELEIISEYKEDLDLRWKPKKA